jgi:hypothetical protein
MEDKLALDHGFRAELPWACGRPDIRTRLQVEEGCDLMA